MKELFLSIVNNGITAGWLILVVLLVRFVGKRMPKWSRVMLWCMVALRLGIPISLESTLSLIPSAETIPVSITNVETPVIHSGIPAVNQFVNPVLEQTHMHRPGDGGNPMENVVSVFAWVWLTVGILLFVVTLFRYFRLRQWVSTATRWQENIYRSEFVTTPFVMGLFRPRIYLPYHMAEKDLPYVIAHEKAHIRWWDHMSKPFAFLLATVYWFHPLVWVAYILFCRDLELACDERVIQSLGSGARADYTEALLGCSMDGNRFSVSPLAFGEVGVKERVRAVLRYRKPTVAVVIGVLVLCGVVAVCFLTNPVTHDAIEWARTLRTADIEKIELVVMPQSRGKQYKLFSTDEMDAVVSLIRESKGTYTESPETLEGQSILFCITMKDGSTHTVCNMGNTYLVIDDQFFEADYTWLAAWDGTYGEGNADYPENFWFFRRTQDSVELLPGTTYISNQCIYMNPLSSTLGLPDSGFYYLIEDDHFAVIHKDTGKLIQMTTTPDPSDKSGYAQYTEIPSWQWQPFPWTNEEWAAMFKPSMLNDKGLLDSYEEILYQPLRNDLCMLSVDGQLWLVDIHENRQMGKFIWSIYSLVPEETVTNGQTAMDSAKVGAIEYMTTLRTEDIRDIIASYDNVDTEALVAVMNRAGENYTPNTVLPENFLCYYMLEIHAAIANTDEPVEEYTLQAGLTENFVKVNFHKGDIQEERYFQDETLYWLVRNCYTTADVLDTNALAPYRSILETRTQNWVDTTENMDGEKAFTGYEILSFYLTDTFTQAETAAAYTYSVYGWDAAFLTDNPDKIPWAGGMNLDSQSRVRALDGYTFFVVKTHADGTTDHRFLFWDLYMGEDENMGRENALERIETAFEKNE